MPNMIPLSLTLLLGREHKIRTLSQFLRSSEVRLVTITGPDGVRKTSLALQVVHDVQDAFTDGVFFISLGVIESPNRLLLDSLKEFLCNRQVLLLLDNFEQIISAVPLLSELLSASAWLRMLATSREALRLRGEHEFPLSPLTLPRESSVETLMPDFIAAVGSSAVDEDGSTASFAGQHETSLNIVGAEAIFQAVMRCWESARSEHALDYRRQ